MTKNLDSWSRPHFTLGGGAAKLFYVAYGNIDLNKPLDCPEYRSLGVPAGMEAFSYDREKQSEGFNRFLEGYIWHQFRDAEPTLAEQVRTSKGCIVVRGSVNDPPTLDYFRDTIGLLTYLMDSGAVAIYDPFAFRWWSAVTWRREVFDRAGPSPRSHVVILWSEEETNSELTWFHTRGMCKFGRPDISVHCVRSVHRDAIIDMIERFIELQAFGGLIAEGQEIKMKSLPAGGRVSHGGDFDDPDFNNVHFEVDWPAESRTNSRESSLP